MLAQFYEVTAYSVQIAPLNQELRQSERIYNTVRPQQALGYLTLREFLAHWQAQPNKARVSVIYWTSTSP